MAEIKAHNIDEKYRTDDIQINENVDFKGLFLSDYVLQGLTKTGFKRPSPIQLKAIPLGRCGLDLIVQAKSGTGKTCVFAVIALENIIIENKNVQVLILTPTREIAVQVAQVILSIGSCIPKMRCFAFIGGTPFTKDKFKLKHCHIAVGTPGRVKQLIEEGYLTTDSIRLFVLDEADKLVADGFQDSINWIYSYLPENKQMIALSATYPESLAELLTRYMRDPTFVRLNASDPSLLGVKQYYKIISNQTSPQKVYDSKFDALLYILNRLPFNQCLIFSNYQSKAQTLSNMLTSHGWPTAFLAGCQAQIQRLQAMATLQQFQCRILVSTDLTARGIDAEHVNLVINMEVPVDADTYLHRIGRSGRFGTIGVAVTLVTENKELEAMQSMISDAKLNMQLLPEVLDETVWTPNPNMSSEVKITDTESLKETKLPQKVESTVEKNNLDHVKNEELSESSTDVKINQKTCCDDTLIPVEKICQELGSDAAKELICEVHHGNEILINIELEEKPLTTLKETVEKLEIQEQQSVEKKIMKTVNGEVVNDEMSKKLEIKDEQNVENKSEKTVKDEAVNDERINYKENDIIMVACADRDNKQQKNKNESKQYCSNNNDIDKQEFNSSSDDVRTCDNINKVDGEIYSNNADLSSDAISISSYLTSKAKKHALSNKIVKAELYPSQKCPPSLLSTTKKKVFRIKSSAEFYESSSSLEGDSLSTESPKKYVYSRKNLHPKLFGELANKNTSKELLQINVKKHIKTKKRGNANSNEHATDTENSSTYQSSSTDLLKGNDTIDIVSDGSSQISSVSFSPIMKEGELDDEAYLSDHTDTKSSAASSLPNKNEIVNSLINVLPPSFTKEDLLNVPGSSYGDLVEDLVAFLEKHEFFPENVNNDDVMHKLANENEREEKDFCSEVKEELSPVVPIPRCIHSYIEWVLANKEKYLLPPEVIASFNEYLFKHQISISSPEVASTDTEKVIEPDNEFHQENFLQPLLTPNKDNQSESVLMATVQVLNAERQSSSKDTKGECNYELNYETIDSNNTDHCFHSTMCESCSDVNESYSNLLSTEYKIPSLAELDRQLSTQHEMYIVQNKAFSETMEKDIQHVGDTSSSQNTVNEDDKNQGALSQINNENEEIESTEESSTCTEDSDSAGNSDNGSSSTVEETDATEKDEHTNAPDCQNHTKLNSHGIKKDHCECHHSKRKDKGTKCHFESHHNLSCIFCQCAYWTMYFRSYSMPCNSCSCCRYWNYHYQYAWYMSRVNNRTFCHECKKCKNCNA